MSNMIALNAVSFPKQHAIESNLADSSLSSSPPVIVLHGLFGSARNWQTFAKNLSAEFTVFTLDLRNHGSSPHCDEMNYPDMACDVIRFLDDHQIETADVIGHSMGGKTAMTLALNFPKRVRRLAIVDIAPVSYSHNYEQLLGKLRGLNLDEIRRRSDANRMLREAIDDDELRLFLLQNLVVKAGEPAVWRINLNAIRQHVNHLVQYTPDDSSITFDGPTSLIRGELSDYVQDAHFPIIRRLFPMVQFHTIDGAGHWPHAQNAVDFLSCIRKILSAP